MLTWLNFYGQANYLSYIAQVVITEFVMTRKILSLSFSCADNSLFSFHF